MLPRSVDEPALRDHASEHALEQARELVEGEAVLSIITRDGETTARVLGRKSYPHHHVVRLEPADGDGAPVDAACTCLPEDAPWCKHVLAVFLTAQRSPELVEQRETIESGLAALPREELETLTRRLLEEKAGLEDVLEVHAERARWRQASAAEGEENGLEVDTDVFRRRVDMVLHGGYLGTFHSRSRARATAEAMMDLVEAARELLDLGYPSQALMVLSTVTDAYLDGWEVIMGLGRWPSVPVDALAETIEDALHEASLSGPQASRWYSRLEDWQAEVEPYGHDEGFKPALAVLDEV